MDKAKKQHWVPRSYLKNFAIPETKNTDNPEAWIFSKEDGDPKKVPIKTFARKKYLYSPQNKEGMRSWDTEDKLSKLESTMAASVWPLFENELFDFEGVESVKKILALFVATLYLRHPSHIEKTKIIHQTLVDFYDGCPKDKDGNPLIEEIMYQDKTYKMDNSNYEAYKSAGKNQIQQMFVNFLNTDAINCAKMFLEKRWSILFSEIPLFITSDKPVVVLNNKAGSYGLKTKGTIIFFPINPTRLLMLDDMHHEPNGQYYPLGKDGPGPINLSLWQNADVYMVSPRHTDEVCVEMLAWADAEENKKSVQQR